MILITIFVLDLSIAKKIIGFLLCFSVLTTNIIITHSQKRKERNKEDKRENFFGNIRRVGCPFSREEMPGGLELAWQYSGISFRRGIQSIRIREEGLSGKRKDNARKIGGCNNAPQKR